VLQRDSGAILNDGGVLQRGEALKSYLDTKHQNPCQQGGCEGAHAWPTSNQDLQTPVVIRKCQPLMNQNEYEQ